jgi:hypothetical protein
LAKDKNPRKARKRSKQHGEPKKPGDPSAFRGRAKIPIERWESYIASENEVDDRQPDQEITHSLNHPLRLDIMTFFSERVISPKAVSVELGVPVSAASYHVGVLAKTSQIDAVGTEQKRGAVEHYYRAKAKPEVTDEEWVKLPDAARRRIASIQLNFLVSEALASLGHGKMDTDDNLAIICSQMRLNKAGREKLGSILAEAQERIEELREEEDPDAPMRFVGLLQFERSRPGKTPLNP